MNNQVEAIRMNCILGDREELIDRDLEKKRQTLKIIRQYRMHKTARVAK